LEKRYLYFAYGSNLNWNQMKERCPQSRFIAIAYYPNHILSFTRQSVSERWGKGSWVADMVFSPGDRVWGVVYELSEPDLINLDKCEGINLERGYLRQEIVVHTKEEERIVAWSYFVKNKTGRGSPSDKYLKVVLAGARFHSLPEDYLDFLEKIEPINL
jgi:gamma-glutamylcyclotransferase